MKIEGGKFLLPQLKKTTKKQAEEVKKATIEEKELTTRVNR